VTVGVTNVVHALAEPYVELRSILVIEHSLNGITRINHEDSVLLQENANLQPRKSSTIVNITFTS